MTRLIHLLLALCLLAAGTASAGAAENGQPRPQVRIVTNGFVLPGKLDRIARFADEAGVTLDSVRADTAPGEPAAWLAGADLVILDTPRPGDLAMVRQRLGTALSDTGVPWVQVGGGPPAFDRMAPEHARRLIAYYANGGEANLRRMAAYIRAWRTGGEVGAVAPAETLPKSGVYHPAAPAPFARTGDYLAWGAARWPADAPRVAFAIHASSLSSMQTQVIDALVAGTEARGLVPMVVWFDAADPQALRSLLEPASSEPAGAAVLVNLHHMQNGPARRAEFEALGIPVLQTLGYRDGGPEAWRSNPGGIAAHLVAPFLAAPEGWGMSDPLVIEAVENGEAVPIPEQVTALLDKAAALAALRHTANADKRLAVMVWNYPPGEKNLSASNLNVPRSLERLTGALATAGYDVPPTAEARLIEAGQAMLGGLYRPETLDRLLADGLAEGFPVARYAAWFAGLPEAVRDGVTGRWGQPEDHWAVRTIDGEARFVIPRLSLGKLTLLPQPPRAGKPGHAHHDVKVPPDHYYLATYLFLRDAVAAHALIHFGTHGTQEWTPGKDRGLWAQDFPLLAVGALPVFYPYIQDNIGEAIQARRRGRAVTVSHQTPAFAPAGLYDELRDLHALVHEYGQLDDGATRDRTARRIRAAATAAGIAGDLDWDEGRMDADFPGFLAVLHDHLHELARHAMPLGLHGFGDPAAPEHRLATVMQQLGEPFYRRLGLDPQEVFAGDFTALKETEPYRLLHRHLRDGVPLDGIAEPELRALLERAAALDRHLADPQELEALLTGLSGGFVRAGPGGDPVRNPDVPSGRNIAAFEPDKIPTRAAYEAGADALAKLIDSYRAEHDGAAPEKIAVSLWSSEAMRHLGVLESQVLHALGLRPAWDGGGRVTALEIVPATELGRPRIDVVLQVTSVYRDQFDGFMRLLAGTIDRLARLDEPGNAVARHSAETARSLIGLGVAPERAQELAGLRLFGNELGDYGSGLPDAVLDSTHWNHDTALADAFLDRLQYAYGAREWGSRLPPDAGNLLAENLRGVQAAVLARSSRLHGVLSTDHPFEYLGGLALAVRRLDGESPSLYIADLRESQARVTGAARFLADELRVRYLNPHWIGAMQAEGYAGTTEIVKTVNNLWGWQVTAPETVRADQWQAVHDTYIRDRRNLGLDGWFEKHNPTAQAQVIERMAEAIRKGYWDADEQTRRDLSERWQALVRDHGVSTGAPATTAFMEAMAAGYAPAPEPSVPTPPAEAAASEAVSETVQGQVMTPVPADGGDDPAAWRVWAGLAFLFLFVLGGAARQAGVNRRLSSSRTLT
ncbi:CobN-like chelatase BtuS for metalloporphyrine salvage [Azospirillum argentinense]|uniref:cobaltochelatase subunit CobN n=1 Tax=Azospirillum argentinense TaxID=2970906 RepID=UPI0032DF43BB